MKKLIGSLLLIASTAVATTNDIDPTDFKCKNGDDSFELRLQYDGRVEVKHFETQGFDLLKKASGTTSTYIVAEFSNFLFTLTLSNEILAGKNGMVYSVASEGLQSEQSRSYCVVKK